MTTSLGLASIHVLTEDESDDTMSAGPYECEARTFCKIAFQ